MQVRHRDFQSWDDPRLDESIVHDSDHGAEYASREDTESLHPQRKRERFCPVEGEQDAESRKPTQRPIDHADDARRGMRELEKQHRKQEQVLHDAPADLHHHGWEEDRA